MITAWQAIVAHCAKLSEEAEQQRDDEPCDHIDPYF